MEKITHLKHKTKRARAFQRERVWRNQVLGIVKAVLSCNVQAVS